ncbi:MAG: hypothetical protein RMK94_12840 [Armatimonadota bacterium]|nr:hypothetical protein [Armatimonadota bacterium]
MNVREVVLAENVLADPEGRLTFYSVIADGIRAPAFPGRLRRLAAMVRFQSPVPFRARAALYAPDGTPLADATGEIPGGDFRWIALFRDVPLPVPGRYRLVIYAGGTAVREVELSVEEER